MPPRALVATLAVALVPLGAGCGLGAGGDKDDVRAVVSSYLDAAASGNGRQACAFYTDEMRRAAKRQARKKDLRTCAAMLSTTVRYRLASLPMNLRRDVEDAIADRDEIDVEMHGEDRARATFAMPHARVPGIDADRAYDTLAEHALDVPFRGSTVRVCSLSHLRLMKQTAGRPQDLVDLENLPAG